MKTRTALMCPIPYFRSLQEYSANHLSHIPQMSYEIRKRAPSK